MSEREGKQQYVPEVSMETAAALGASIDDMGPETYGQVTGMKFAEEQPVLWDWMKRSISNFAPTEQIGKRMLSQLLVTYDAISMQVEADEMNRHIEQ
jgi:hypothetical protein